MNNNVSKYFMTAIDVPLAKYWKEYLWEVRNFSGDWSKVLPLLQKQKIHPKRYFHLLMAIPVLAISVLLKYQNCQRGGRRNGGMDERLMHHVKNPPDFTPGGKEKKGNSVR